MYPPPNIIIEDTNTNQSACLKSKLITYIKYHKGLLEINNNYIAM